MRKNRICSLILMCAFVGKGASAQTFSIEEYLESRPALSQNAAEFGAASIRRPDFMSREERENFDKLNRLNLDLFLTEYNSAKNQITYQRAGYRLLSAAAHDVAGNSTPASMRASVAISVAMEGVDIAVEEILDRQEQKAYGLLGAALQDYLRENNLGPEFFYDPRFRGNPNTILKELNDSGIDPLNPSQIKDWTPEETAIFNRTMLGALNREVNVLIAAAVRSDEEATARLNDIRKLSQTQITFVKNTEKDIQAIYAEIDSVNQEIEEISDEIERVDAEVSVNRGDIEFLQSYMFSNMTPAEQSAALRAGVVGRNLDPEARRVLQEKLDLVARRDKLISDIGSYINGAGEIVQIAKNIGVSLPPEVADAAEKAQIAFDAFSAFSGGNYLASVRMVTGAFGGGADASTQRHQQIVGMLNEVLNGIGELKQGQQEIKQLIALSIENQSKILDNQKLLFQSILELSLDIERKHTAISRKLDFVGREIFNARVALSGLIWENVSQCNSALDLLDQEPFSVLRPDDLSPTALQNWLNSNESTLARCLAGLRDRIVSPTVDQWHLDARVNPDERGIDGKLADLWTRSLYRPLAEEILATDVYGEQQLTKRQRLASLTIPVETVLDLDDKLRSIAKEETPVPERVEMLLAHQKDPNDWPSESTILLDVLAPEKAVVLYRHLLTFSSMFELSEIRPESVTLKSSAELVSRTSPIEEGLSKANWALTVVDIVLAQQSVLSGDLLLPSVYKLLEGTGDKLPSPEQQCADGAGNVVEPSVCGYEKALRILADGFDGENRASKEVLRRNAVTYILVKERNDGFQGNLPYKFALNSNSPIGLRKMFGQKWDFVKTDGKWFFRLAGRGGLEELLIPMPEPEALFQGRLIFPSIVRDLVELRDDLADYVLGFKAARDRNADSSDIFYQSVVFSAL